MKMLEHKRQTICDSFRVGFKAFCEQTSLHGWSFISFEKSKPLSTLFWLIAILAAMLVCSQLTLQNVNEFEEAVEFNVESLTANLDEVYFPSLYFINKGRMRMSTTLHLMHETNRMTNETLNPNTFVTVLVKYLNGLPLTKREKRMGDAILKSNITKKMFDRFVIENKIRYPMFESKANLFHNHSIQYLTEDQIEKRFETMAISAGGYFQNMFGFTQLSDFLLDIKFSGEGVLHFGGRFSDIPEPRNVFVPYFKCPTRNESLRSFINPLAKSGIEQGIEILLDAEVYDAMNLIKSGGFRMGIAHPMDSELSQFHGINLDPGKEIEMSVSTHLIKTSRDIRFNAEERNCYFDDEIELDHFPSHWFRYSIDNCLLEATFQKIEDICNCTSLLAKSVPKGFEYCKNHQLQCLRFGKVKNMKIGENEFITSRGERKRCRANCNDQPFSKSVTSSNIDSYSASLRMLVLKKVMESCKNFKKIILNQWYEGICDLNFEEEMVIFKFNLA